MICDIVILPDPDYLPNFVFTRCNADSNTCIISDARLSTCIEKYCPRAHLINVDNINQLPMYDKLMLQAIHQLQPKMVLVDYMYGIDETDRWIRSKRMRTMQLQYGFKVILLTQKNYFLNARFSNYSYGRYVVNNIFIPIGKDYAVDEKIIRKHKRAKYSYYELFTLIHIKTDCAYTDAHFR